MSERGIETRLVPGTNELGRLDRYGRELGSALNHVIALEGLLSMSGINWMLSNRATEWIVSARERLVVQVELARKSEDPVRASLAERAVGEYAEALDLQTKVTLIIPSTSAS